MKLFLAVLATAVAIVLGLFAMYLWDSSKNRGSESGYYGQFNRVRNALTSVPGVTITNSWHTHDISLEEFSFDILFEGRPLELFFAVGDPVRTMSREAATAELQHRIQSQLASRPAKSAASSEEQMPSKLAGVWLCVHKYASGWDVTHTVEVGADGACTNKILIPERKVGPRTINQTGTWHIRDGVLVETIISDSQTNARLPTVSRYKIGRLDDRELELDVADKVEGVVYPTNQLIYRKQTR